MTQASQSSHLSHLSQLDHLRPPPGWKTDCAVLSTYSAQTPVIAAALLALAGENDESGSGTKVGLTRALTGLRGRVHFVLQSGRLSMPRKPSTIVSLLDRFILQVPWDEGSKGIHLGQSWHAKFAIVRHVPEVAAEKSERWVFMLGSRNLTMDLSWDIGLVIRAGDDAIRGQKTVPQVIDGIGQIAADLAGMFPLELKHWASFSKPLRKAQWQVPEGLVVSEIRLLLPDTPGRALPMPAEPVRRVLAVAPFLDGKAVGKVAAWGDSNTPSQLLSTRIALEKLARQAKSKLGKFKELLVLPSPDHEIILGKDVTREGADDDEQVVADQLGLHAKILFAEHGNGGTLWLGSPNLSERAWTRNAECYAQVIIQSAVSESGRLLLGGIEAFVSLAELVPLEAMATGDEEISAKERLAQARVQVSARLVGAVQTRGKNNTLVVKCVGVPHPDAVDISLACSPLIGEPVVWPRKQSRFEVEGAANSIAKSDCLRIRLSLNGDAMEWVQVVPWNPPLDDARDEAVLSDYLGPRQMMSWIHEVLSGYSNGDEGGLWDAPLFKSTKLRHGPVVILGLPSIDQALRMWLKDKAKLNEVDRILQIWMCRTKASTSTGSKADQDVEIHLQRFSRSWTALRKGLPKDQL